MAKKRETKAILVVEDEADIRSFVSRVLELEGYCIFQAKNGNEGIKIAREMKVALILLDLVLPGYDGWSLLAEMKSEPALSVIPVVVFTASAEIQQRERALGMGAADYLVKPISAARLRKTVVRILRMGR